MTSDDTFIAVIASAPDDVATELVYADWLEERGDRRADLLRLRADLLTADYSDATYKRVVALLEQYREMRGTVKPEWFTRLAAARPWISRRLAVTLARVYLRRVHGRKEDRQWVKLQKQRPGQWLVTYWNDDPARLQSGPHPERHRRVWLAVDQASGVVAPARYPCPCCGYNVFRCPPGSFAICPICFWSDDDVGFAFPDAAIGANHVSLTMGQMHFAAFGATEMRARPYVRAPQESDLRDAAWRPLDPQRDRYLSLDRPGDQQRWQADLNSGRRCLYYWLPEYWLAQPPPGPEAG